MDNLKKCRYCKYYGVTSDEHKWFFEAYCTKSNENKQLFESCDNFDLTDELKKFLGGKE